MAKLRRTGSTDLAVKLQTVKDALRIDGTNEDTYLKRLILAATGMIEKSINTDILKATYTFQTIETAGNSHSFYLPENYDLPTTTNATYEIVEDVLTLTAETTDTMSVTLTAGLASDIDEVDLDLGEAINQLVVHMYENRDQQVMGIPATVEMLIQPFRVYV